MSEFHSHKWPNHVPADIWKAYYGFPWAPKLMESSEFEPLWNALREQQAQHPPEHAWHEVVEAVAQSMENFPGADPMPKVERRKHAVKVKNAVAKLEAELDAISGGAGELNLHVDLLLSWLDGSPLNGIAPFDHRVREVLPALTRAVDSWADCGPQVSHLNSDGAKPLWMARNLRRVFLRLYDRPLDNHVIAICEVYFGSLDYDSATLRRVAPKDKLLKYEI